MLTLSLVSFKKEPPMKRILMTLILFVCGCGSSTISKPLPPSTLGAYYDQAIMFWTQVDNATQYNIYYSSSANPTCPMHFSDYTKLEIVASDPRVHTEDCSTVLATGTNGGYGGPTPTGTCLTL